MSDPVLVLGGICSSGQALDDSDHFIGAKPLTTGEVQELSGFGNDGTTLWRARHADASSPTEFEKPFVAQNAQRPQHGIGVDAEDRSEVFGRRQPLAWPRFTLGNGAPDFAGHLFVERERVGTVNVDG